MSPEATSRPKASRIPFVAALLAGSALFSGVLGVLREAVLAGMRPMRLPRLRSRH